MVIVKAFLASEFSVVKNDWASKSRKSFLYCVKDVTGDLINSLKRPTSRMK